MIIYQKKQIKKTLLFMINPISLKSDCRLQSLLTRYPPAKLWRFCHQSTKSGIVTLLMPEILALFNISRATLYRWLKQGKELGMFRYYKKISKFKIYIVLGSKKAVTEKLKLTDWGAVVEKPLAEILTKKENQLRQQTTLHHTQWLEMKSHHAAKAKKGKKRFKPYKPKFGKIGEPKLKKAIGKPIPKDSRRATSMATRQNMQPPRRDKREDKQTTPPIKKTAFSRHHTPIGSSQQTIADQLRVSKRTVRRHLAKTESVQVMYKVKKITEAMATLFYAKEEGIQTPYFVRNREIYRYGNNLYNLNETLKSEFTQRVKYKFYLFTKMARLRNLLDKKDLSFEDFREFYSDFSLNSLDEYCLLILWKYNFNKSFKEFYSNLKEELKALRKWNQGKSHKAPLLTGR